MNNSGYKREMDHREIKEYLAFYPYLPYYDSYIGVILGMLSSDFKVIDYEYLRSEIFPLEHISYIYLNWLEDKLDERDYRILVNAHKIGIRIIWVFHNRIPHNLLDSSKVLPKMKFLVEISDVVILHSKKSKALLFKYSDTINENSVYYIPHPDYFDMYYKGVSIRKKYGIEDGFIFLLPKISKFLLMFLMTCKKRCPILI